MTEPIQGAIPGTDTPAEPVRKRRGRPPGTFGRMRGTLFSDGMGDYRLYTIEADGVLHPVLEAPGFIDGKEGTAWLRKHGAREDLMGRDVLMVRGISVVRIEMAPALRFKPRGKPPATKAKALPLPKREPEPASA
jgi:hypothetical protein